MFIAQRSEILKAVEGKIGEVYDACFGKREYWPAQCLARAKVKWGSWKNGDHSSVKQTYIDVISCFEMALRMTIIIDKQIMPLWQMLSIKWMWLKILLREFTP